MASVSPEQHIEAFLDEWQTTTLQVRDMLRVKDTSFLKDCVHLQEMPSANMVSRAGSRHLDAIRGPSGAVDARQELLEDRSAHSPL